MGTKSVRLEEDLYERIKAHKREDETFSEAIDRLIGGFSLLDLAGTMSEEEAQRHLDAIEAAEETDVAEAKVLLDEPGADGETDGDPGH